MILSERTLELLKNYSTINNSIMFRPGNILRTASNSKTIMAEAKIEENFESSFAIFDLSRFLGILSLMENPNIDAKDNYAEITDKHGRNVSYTFTDPDMIYYPPDKKIVMPSVDVSFELQWDDMQFVQKALAILKLPVFAVRGDGHNISIMADDPNNTTIDRDWETEGITIFLSGG